MVASQQPSEIFNPAHLVKTSKGVTVLTFTQFFLASAALVALVNFSSKLENTTTCIFPNASRSVDGLENNVKHLDHQHIHRCRCQATRLRQTLRGSVSYLFSISQLQE